MTLKELLRHDFTSYVRPHFAKDTCEMCGSETEQLHVHHVTYFQDLLDETLEQLQLEYHEESEAYTESQIEMIRNVMLGKQMRIKYVTCCESCHLELHTKPNERTGMKNPIKRYYKMYCNGRSKETREMAKIELEKIMKEIDDKLNKLVGIVDKEKKELIFEITYEDGGRTLRGVDLWFNCSYVKLPYKLYQKRINSKLVWILERKQEKKFSYVRGIRV